LPVSTVCSPLSSASNVAGALSSEEKKAYILSEGSASAVVADLKKRPSSKSSAQARAVNRSGNLISAVCFACFHCFFTAFSYASNVAGALSWEEKKAYILSEGSASEVADLKKRPSSKSSNMQPLPKKKKKNKEVYEVEKVLDVRLNSDGMNEFLILWKGYPKSQATWEPIENLEGEACKALPIIFSCCYCNLTI
jgi:hypothetical protein